MLTPATLQVILVQVQCMGAPGGFADSLTDALAIIEYLSCNLNLHLLKRPNSCLLLNQIKITQIKTPIEKEHTFSSNLIHLHGSGFVKKVWYMLDQQYILCRRSKGSNSVDIVLRY